MKTLVFPAATPCLAGSPQKCAVRESDHGCTAHARRRLTLQPHLPATTPVAIIQNASLAQQRHALCTLEELDATIATEHLGSPSVIVVGDVLQGLLSLQMSQDFQTARKSGAHL